MCCVHVVCKRNPRWVRKSENSFCSNNGPATCSSFDSLPKETNRASAPVRGVSASVVGWLTWSGTEVDNGISRFQYAKPFVHLLQLERRSGPQAFRMRLRTVVAGDERHFGSGRRRHTCLTYMSRCCLSIHLFDESVLYTVGFCRSRPAAGLPSRRDDNVLACSHCHARANLRIRPRSGGLSGSNEPAAIPRKIVLPVRTLRLQQVPRRNHRG